MKLQLVSLCARTKGWQVIVELSDSGPLCFEVQPETTVAEVKSEIEQRYGLPTSKQNLFCGNLKVKEEDVVKCFADKNGKEVCFTLNNGLLKGGAPPVEEGAFGGEDMSSKDLPPDHMFFWGVDKVCEWLEEIQIDKKYIEKFRAEEVDGKSLLCLNKNSEKLKLVFNMKAGPLKILQFELSVYSKDYDNYIQKWRENGPIRCWDTKQLVNWLEGIGLPKKYLSLCEEEEINGKAFGILSTSISNLVEILQLKEGPLALLLENVQLYNDSLQKASPEEIPAQRSSVKVTENISDSASFCEISPDHHSLSQTIEQPTVSNIGTGKVREERLADILAEKLQLDFHYSSNKDHLEAEECTAQLMYFQTGASGNSLENAFQFVVIWKGEKSTLNPQLSRKLWRSIRVCALDFMTLLNAKDLSNFKITEKDIRDKKTDKLLEIRDGKSISYNYLDKILTKPEKKDSCFVLLIDAQMVLETKKMYHFKGGKKGHPVYFSISSKDPFIASFDISKMDAGLQWSEWFIDHKKNAARIQQGLSIPSTPLDTRENPSKSANETFLENPREFDTDVKNKTYRQAFILNCHESGPIDLLRPFHEFKLLVNAVSSGEDAYVKKFILETVRFACACLNERSNGTIHFGIADHDSKVAKAEGCRPCEIVGVPLSNRGLFDDKLKEYIGKCFEDHSIVRSCIRPPIFVPVKLTTTTSSTSRISRNVIEVDIVPRFCYTNNEIFKVCLSICEPEKQSKKNVFVAYVREGANSRQLREGEIEEMLQKRLPKLDNERNRLEHQEIVEPKSREKTTAYLFNKLQRLLCAGNKVLDSSVYPVLVLTKPDEKMDESYLSQHFGFISKVNWQLVIDFDFEGSKDSNLCKIFTGRADTNVSPLCSIHEAADFDGDDNLNEDILSQTCWIFANGYSKLGQKAVDFIKWRNSKRKRGITEVIKFLSTEIPKTRIVVLFALLSQYYEFAADIFAEFCTYLDGPNQLLYVAEDNDISSSWETLLCRTCVEESVVKDRGVVGMSWAEFQDTVLEMVSGIDLAKIYLPMSAGGLCQLTGDKFINISILSATECAQLENLNIKDQKLCSYEEQINFYRGNPVSWKNFWFTDQGENHVLKRDKYVDLKDKIEQSLKGFTEQRVQTVNLFYQVGAGASTLARHVLWDLKNDCRADYRCRCAIVTHITDDTCTEIFRLRRIGYSSEEDSSCPPVLVLIENVDDILFKELRFQVIDKSVSIPSTGRPICLFLYCKPISNPRDYSVRSQTSLSSVCLEQRLSKKEVNWFKNKLKTMERKFKELEKDYDVKYDFNKFASDNLISFMLMKENFNPQYAKNVVKRNLDDMPNFELNMLTNLALLNVHDPHEVFAACFDSIMLSDGMKKKHYFRNWMNDLSPSARVFLKEIDRSEDFGTGKAIAIAHPIIASEILDEVAKRKNASVGDIALSFLQSDLFREQAKYSFPLQRLRETTLIMLKHRKKYEYGDDEQTIFSPLIEKILYTSPTSKEATKESILKASEVLEEGLKKFKDSIIAQQIARVFYVNAMQFGKEKSVAESCFESALEYGNKAVDMNPGNSFILDTMGRIFESKLKLSFGLILEENQFLKIADTIPLLKFSSSAVHWFQKSQETSKEDQNIENNCGFLGELSIIFFLLDVLRCVELFRNQDGLELLRRYLSEKNFVPKVVAEIWKDFHSFMKTIEERYFCCMEELIEEYSLFKENSVEYRFLPRAIARFKFQYLNYFGKEHLPEQISTDPQSWKYRWEYRWQQINHYLAGDLFYGVFNIRAENSQSVSDSRETLEKLRSLVQENFKEELYRNQYKDLLLMITLSLSQHSPFAPRRFAPSVIPTEKQSNRLVEEYKEIYRLVEKLSVLEMEKQETGQRIYGRFFKVMFLWPREEMELGKNYYPEEFYDALRQLQNDFELKRQKSSTSVDKWLKQTVHKKMTFKERGRQYTTLFYLGKGKGLDVFVHRNELPLVYGKQSMSVKWDDHYTKSRLQRWNGTLESRNSIAVKNRLDSGKKISLYYAGGHERQFSKEDVSFFIGFSWASPIALDVHFQRNDQERVVDFSQELYLRGDLIPSKMKAYGWEMLTYDGYVARFKTLKRKLQEINRLKGKRKKQQLNQKEEEELSKERCYWKEIAALREQYFDFEDID